MAIGLIIFIFLLFRKKKEFTAFRAIGLFFMLTYLGFFLTIIFSNKIRGNIIAGFNLGIKYTGIEVQPKITSVYPENFTLGTNDKIYLYGRHLNKIDTLKVFLRTGTQVKYTFPKDNIIVASQNRIVLGNFKTWRPPVFAEFKNFVGPSEQAILNSAQYKRFAALVNESVNPRISNLQNIVPLNIQPVTNLPVSNTTTTNIRRVARRNINEIQNIRNNLAIQEFGVVQSQAILVKLHDFFINRFKLPEGDYGIVAFDNLTEIESPQLITISYPVPPAPLPDIFPMEITWIEPIAVSGRPTALNVKLGFSHPEEIKNSFSVRITSSPVLPQKIITVPMGVITGAISSKQAVVTTSQFTITNHGNFIFTVSVDYNNKVQEENEGNNTISSTLEVKRYTYDLEVKYSTFESKTNEDDGDLDEYRVTIHTSVTGHEDWTIRYNKDGEPGNVYTINQSRKFTNLIPGHFYTFYSTVYEYDDGLRDGDDYMGERSVYHHLSADIKDQDLVQYPILLETNQYKITGQYTITRKIQ